MKAFLAIMFLFYASVEANDWEKIKADIAEDNDQLKDIGINFSDIWALNMEVKDCGIVYRKYRLKYGGSGADEKLHFRVKKFRSGADLTSWYTAFYTEEDEDDGGNSFGWIEDANGKPVATIQDSEISVLGGLFYDKDGKYRERK